MSKCSSGCSHHAPAPPASPGDGDEGGGMTRRTALKALGAKLGAAAFAQAIAPLTEWSDNLSLD